MSTNNPATDILPSFMWQNFGKLSGTTLTASSEEIGYPVQNIVNPLRSKTWRSKQGWNIVASFNDRLDFTEGVTGDASAEIAVGNYATGDEMATQLQTAINAAATDNSYAVTYSATTYKFTIARSSGAATIGLEWSTGANTARSVGECLGFDVSADDTGATTYTGDNAAYKSREFVIFSMSQALSMQVALVLDYNFQANDTIKFQADASPSGWASPDSNTTLTEENANKTIRKKYFSSVSKQYIRMLVNDVTYNITGYTNIGLFYFGGFMLMARDFGMNFTQGRRELSKAVNADQGAPWLNSRPSAWTWGLAWNGISTGDKDNLNTMQDTVRINKGFFVDLEGTSTSTMKTQYVKMTRPLQFQLIILNYVYIINTFCPDVQ
jgi:hypothetical protein